MQALSPQHILRTDQGKVFDLDLDAGYSFGMCLDLARLLLELKARGITDILPRAADLNPAAWESLRAGYRADDSQGNGRLVKLCGLRTSSRTPLTGFGGHFLQLVYSLIDQQGATLLTLVGYGGSHEVLWYRDDERGLWLFFDPYSGLWQFDSLVGVAPSLAAELVARYDDLGQLYRTATLELR